MYTRTTAPVDERTPLCRLCCTRQDRNVTSAPSQAQKAFVAAYPNWQDAISMPAEFSAYPDVQAFETHNASSRTFSAPENATPYPPTVRYRCFSTLACSGSFVFPTTRNGAFVVPESLMPNATGISSS